jgi:hypothetical protein
MAKATFLESASVFLAGTQLEEGVTVSCLGVHLEVVPSLDCSAAKRPAKQAGHAETRHWEQQTL